MRFLAAALVVLFASSAFAQIKVYISADMEGIGGVVTGEQLGPQGFEYERFRKFMTDEVLAAIRGARAAGATEFLVSDSHGNGQNLLIDELPDDVQLVRSWPRPLGMMEGIDDSFDAVIFVGYHTSTSNPAGVRAHTFSSATLTDVRLNGVSVSEAGFNAAIAGHFGVPVGMISGDDAIVAEAERYIGDLEGAIVKHALSFHSARSLTPKASCDLIEETAKRAVERRDFLSPFRLDPEITLDVSFKNYRQAEMMAYLPIVERTDSHSIRFVGKDMVAVSKFVQFMNGYDTGLTP
ncbi:MAG: M55 family metallopeptidase [Vicinamibacteria bacterium]